jgi:competence protein ComEA
MNPKQLIVSSFVVLSLIFSTGVQAAASKKSFSGHLNLNTATAEQIDLLPGVSPKKAQAIVDYRKDHPFKTVEELDNVKGFSAKSIEKLKPFVGIDGLNNLAVEGGKTKAPNAAVDPSKKKNPTAG